MSSKQHSTKFRQSLKLTQLSVNRLVLVMSLSFLSLEYLSVLQLVEAVVTRIKGVAVQVLAVE